MYASSGENITEQLFVRYGHNIINKACLIATPESVRTLLPTSLLNNELTLSIITSNTSQVVEIIKHASRDYATEFIVEIKSVLEVEKNKELAELLHLLEASPTSKEISVANRS